MKKLLGKLRGLTRRDDGASAVEYGLLVALIAVIIAGTVLVLGNALQNRFQQACDTVTHGGGTSQTCPVQNPAAP